MEKFFQLKEHKTTPAIEIQAGITTFMAMAYILMVNAGMFNAMDEAGNLLVHQQITFGSIYIATALSSAIGTILIGLMANLPLAQAPGMGLNAFFVYTICAGLGFTYSNALLFVLFDGLLFVTLTITGTKQLILDAIPSGIKKAIPIGIGLFIAFIGVQDAGIVAKDASTGVTLASFNFIFNPNISWAQVLPYFITIATLFAIIRLTKKGFRGAIFCSMVGGAIVYYLIAAVTVPGFFNGFFDGYSLNPLNAFVEFGQFSFLRVFRDGFDFSYYLQNHSSFQLVFNLIAQSLVFCMNDMFDTLGTLFGACKSGNLLVKNPETGEDEVPRSMRAMLADAIATAVGAFFGTSTVTTYVESNAGISAGGRTGLSSMVTGALFVVSLFFAPIAALVPACVYSAALIYVGYLMFKGAFDSSWLEEDLAVAFAAFITAVMMPFSYSISNGIAFGLIVYIGTVVKSKILNRGVEVKTKIPVATWTITALFLITFLTTH